MPDADSHPPEGKAGESDKAVHYEFKRLEQG